MKKENQRISISKRLLKEALLKLLNYKDISKISITELCREAGINRSTFYRYYNVPQDLLVDIEKELIENVQNVAPIPVKAEDILPYLEKLFTYIYDNAKISKIIIRSNSEVNFVHMIDVCNTAFLKANASAMDNFPFDKIDKKLLSVFLGSGGYYLVRAWLIDDIPKTPKEIAQLIYELLKRNLDTYLIK
ncbi:MAG: TetR/AcrR family transcriptional regulator C-terminal domain-containing protein [Ruminococcus sp.]|nr:TetR/AcrR family transcriptional regulator C-terminal domain-containing protein [Ruminococcus sp.]